ncbi:MAG: NAD(P)/FAD-dependent oxidoreductase, partial [Cyanobacteria bacterium J06626_18]
MTEASRPGDSEKIVVVGAGFGGFQAAQSLAGADANVLLIDCNNYSTFVPLLYQVATAQLEPSLVTYPIRTKLRGMGNVQFLQTQVEWVDFHNKLLKTAAGPIAYDYLVMATGTQPSYHGIPGASKHTFTLKTLNDAIALRNHILSCFEAAARTPDLHEQQRLLTFVIVGGGATGVEVAGALAELLRGAFGRDFAELAGEGRILLIQSGSGLLQEFSQRLGNYTHRHLENLGVEVHLNTRIAQVEAAQVVLDTGKVIATAAVVWAAGLEAALPVLAQSPAAAQKRRLVVRETLQLADYGNIYAIGDVAYFAKDQKPLSGVAPEALQQGVWVARNLRRQLQGQLPQPFRYWNKGRLAIIGGYGGVGRIAGINFGGILAWAMWLAVHGVYLPGYRSRLFVFLTWIQNY